MRRPLSVLLTVVTGLLLLAAGTSASSARPAAPATIPAANRVIGYNAWGALRLGMSHEDAHRTGMVSLARDQCAAGYQMARSYRGLGHVVWVGSMLKVGEFVLDSPTLRTRKGMHVGSTLRQLRAAYPDLSLVRRSETATLGGGTHQTGPDDLYYAYVRNRTGVINFQFAYGPRPTATSRVDEIVVARQTAVYFGC